MVTTTSAAMDSAGCCGARCVDANGTPPNAPAVDPAGPLLIHLCNLSLYPLRLLAHLRHVHLWNDDRSTTSRCTGGLSLRLIAPKASRWSWPTPRGKAFAPLFPHCRSMGLTCRKAPSLDRAHTRIPDAEPVGTERASLPALRPSSEREDPPTCSAYETSTLACLRLKSCAMSA